MAITWINAEDLDDPSSPFAQDAAETASWILYKLTGEKYPGIRTTTQWYGRDASECVHAFRDIVDAYYEIREDSPRQLRTRNTPIVLVETIHEGSRLLDPEEYLTFNHAYVIKTNKSYWDYEKGVTINYLHGTAPPRAGIVAAKRLARELDLAAKGDEECALPSRITSVSRQGIDYAILDPQDFISEGRTGLHEVDMFIHAANPYKALKKPKVFSPDIPSGRLYR